MDQQKPFVITVVGPESSGKTTLARELASFYGCPWVPEFAREYLETLGRPYEQGDLEVIAKGQLAVVSRQLAVCSSQSADGNQQFTVGSPWVEKEIPAFLKEDSRAAILSFNLEAYGDKGRPILIVDSGMLSLRLWARIKYGISIPMVEEALMEDMTSMYILCRPVHGWDPDPLREAPSLLDRAWIYNQYLKEVSAIQSR
jgi:nicotinamide riboside kinase